MLRGAVPLAAILEPIGDLRQSEAGLFGQGSFLVRCGVAVLAVTVLEGGARLLLEAVDGLFTVPNRLGQRVLASQPVLVHRPQRPVPHLLRFLINTHKSFLQSSLFNQSNPSHPFPSHPIPSHPINRDSCRTAR